MTIKRRIKHIQPSHFLIGLFFIVNLLTLMHFPVVHSDELWLRGIADEMLLQNSFSVTEPFFDLYPRVVHPFRWLYNLVLIGFFSIFGSSAFTMRLVALTFGALSLLIFDKLIEKRFSSNLYRIIGTSILALDVQFIYSSHMGRQETMILFLLLLGVRIALSEKWKQAPYAMAILVLIGMGIHPNSFILGVVFSMLLAYKAISAYAPVKDLFRFWGATGLGVLAYAIIGFIMNPNFISGYLRFGATLGVDAPLMNRFEGFYWYFIKLFKQIGGTYDLMDIRMTLILMAILLVFWTIVIFKNAFNGAHRHKLAFYPALVTLGIAISFLIIGRYNQTAIIFIVPFTLLMAFEAISAYAIQLNTALPKVLMLIMLIAWCVNLYTNLEAYDRHRFYNTTYEDMLETLNAYVPDDAIVLANLNTIEAFDSRRFYDIRNLAFLEHDEKAFGDYVEERAIQYIILHEEMDYIARNKSRWGFLYGDIQYYDAMTAYINEKTRLIGSFENPIYAMRLSRYSGTYPWRTFIYQVID